jgi:hypothetical protein
MGAGRPFSCVDCGASGVCPARGRLRLRCDACIVAYKNAERRARRSGDALPRRCPRCAGPVRRGARRTYCSDACRFGSRSCEHCRGSYVPTESGQRFCSPSCAYAVRRGVAPFAPLPRSLACRGCGVEVVTTGTVVLCEPCREQRAREHWQGKNRRRRAALRQVPSEPYTLAEIAERDGLCCQLCRRPVDMALIVPDLWAPTIDHRTPLALGGDDTRANVQLAHFICNSRKGAALEVAA